MTTSLFSIRQTIEFYETDRCEELSSKCFQVNIPGITTSGVTMSRTKSAHYEAEFSVDLPAHITPTVKWGVSGKFIQKI